MTTAVLDAPDLTTLKAEKVAAGIELDCALRQFKFFRTPEARKRLRNAEAAMKDVKARIKAAR